MTPTLFLGFNGRMLLLVYILDLLMSIPKKRKDRDITLTLFATFKAKLFNNIRQHQIGNEFNKPGRTRSFLRNRKKNSLKKIILCATCKEHTYAFMVGKTHLVGSFFTIFFIL